MSKNCLSWPNGCSSFGHLSNFQYQLVAPSTGAVRLADSPSKILVPLSPDFSIELSSSRASFARKYSNAVLEETCKQVLSYGKVTYTAVKNCICAVSEAMGTDDPTTAEGIYAERNKGAYVMGEDSMDIDNLLSRSQSLAQSKRKDGDT